MNSEQFLKDFLENRIPPKTSVADFYKAAGEEKSQIIELADDIVDIQGSNREAAAHPQSQSYAALADERAKIVANMDVPNSQTDRVERERRLDDIQQDMEGNSLADGDSASKVAEKMSKLEDLTRRVLQRM